MFLMSLVRTRQSEAVSDERLIRTVTPAKASRRIQAEPAATVPEKSKRKAGWMAGFEQMMAAYTELILRDLR